MNRRSFLGALGVFAILPGAGRVWRAVREPALTFRANTIGVVPTLETFGPPMSGDPLRLLRAFFEGVYAEKGGHRFRIRDGLLVPIPA